jgi:predicted dehydrogenase
MKNEKVILKSSRRDFIKKAAIGTAAFYIVPRHVLGRGYIAPSDKLNIAGVGAGGKGTSDIANSWQKGKENIVAICDVDERQGKQTRKDHPNAPFYKDYRVMLEKEGKNVDAVIVSTPDHMHAPVGLAAMSLGKHVYIQKPLAHSIFETRQLTEAAHRYKVVTQMGNQGASGEGVRIMKEWYEAGLIGEVNEVHCWTNRPVWPQGNAMPTGKNDIPKELDFELWTGVAPRKEYFPQLLPFNWRGYWDFGTGSLGDMGCHIMEPPHRIMGLGYPSEVECSVGLSWSGFFKETIAPESCPASSVVHLKFPRAKGKDVKLSWYDGGILPQRPDLLPADISYAGWFGGGGGMMMIGKKGIIMSGVYGREPKIFPQALEEKAKKVKLKYPRVEDGWGIGHHIEWVEACKLGYKKKELSSDFDIAGPLTEAVLMGNIAIRSYWLAEGKDASKRDNFTGRKRLLWDGKAMKITNFDLANQFVKRDYRTGW